jgi:flagellar protein FlaG
VEVNILNINENMTIGAYSNQSKSQEISVPVTEINKIITDNITITEKIRENPEYKPSISEKVMLQTIEDANKKLSGSQAEFEFSVHEATKQIMIKVKNKDTGEIIREIPPEKTLDIVAKMWELAGIIIDEKR